jgi:hypothetical protein
LARSGKQIAALQRHKVAFDFSQDRLGEDLCKIATDGCLENVIGENSPDGTPWAPLSEDYAKYKQLNYPGSPVGVLHFLMAQPQEIAGQASIDPLLAKVSYGVSDQAKQEMAWFTEGDTSRNRPPRPFWGFTTRSIEASAALLKKTFHNNIK